MAYFADAIAAIYALTGGTDPFGMKDQDAIDQTYANLVAKWTDRAPSAVSTVTFNAPLNATGAGPGSTISVDSPDGTVVVGDRTAYPLMNGTWEVHVEAATDTTYADTVWRAKALAGYEGDPLWDTGLIANGSTSTDLSFPALDPDSFYPAELKYLTFDGYRVSMTVTMQCTAPRDLVLTGFGLKTRQEPMIAKFRDLLARAAEIDINSFAP